MRVLCGWELGAGLGHVGRLRPIVEGLRAAGAEIVLALQQIENVSAFTGPDGLLPEGMTLVPVPRWDMPKNPEARNMATHSLADVMTVIGIPREGLLGPRVAAWRGLIDMVRPDLILGDFSPFLRMASHGRVPMVMVGNGYTTPPADRPLPPIRPWENSLEPLQQDREAALLKLINDVMVLHGSKPLAYLADVLNGDETFVFTLPLVDPYAAYRTEPQLPPVNLPKGIAPKSWGDRVPGGVFFYMPGTHPRIQETIDAVKSAGVTTRAHIGNLTPAGAEKYAAPKFQISLAPLPFEVELPQARAIVHHAGLSTAIAAVQAGTPQLILPWNLEHMITARAVESLGGAVIVGAAPQWTKETISRALRKMVGDRELAARARAAAGKLVIGDPAPGLEMVIQRCLALGGGS